MQSVELVGEEINIAKAQDAQTDMLLSKANVIGVGVGRKLKERTGEVFDKKPCLSVLVSQKLDENELSDADRIEKKIDGFETDVLTVGEVFAGAMPQLYDPAYNDTERGSGPPPPAGMPGPAPGPGEDYLEEGEPLLDADIQLLRGRVRPAMGGYSVGHPRVTAGTIATGVVDSNAAPGIPTKYYILSNNHVLANSNFSRIGDPILQPGTADGGRYPRDMIGRLSRFIPIRFGGPANYVDAAIAEVPFHNLNREIFWVGYPGKTIAGVRVGQVVQKTGRTTNYTQGRVRVLNATVNVNYGGGRVARFVRQIVTTNMSAGGDSGSLVLDLDDRPIGLLFAGSSVATILNPIGYVQNLLRIKIGL